jgi:hypothetical protein
MLVAYGLRPVGNDSKHEIDFGRLRARVREKPRTKAGQVRQAWPEIRDLIAAGHSLKDIWAWLNESGISIGYARLSHYIGQLRRKEKEGGRPGRAVDSDDAALQTNAAAPTQIVGQNPTVQDRSTPDPLANVREREKTRPGFSYNSQPDLSKLI